MNALLRVGALTFLAQCAALVTSCATAEGPRAQTDASQQVDARLDSRQDAPPPADAPPMPPMPQERTLSQTTSDVPAANNSSACNTAAGYTSEMGYYRAFKLSDVGITTAFNVTKVALGVEYAQVGSGATQAAQIKLHTYAGTLGTATLNPAQLTLIHAANITIANTATPKVMEFALTKQVPAGSTLVVELAIPNGAATSTTFYIGSNNGGESAPSYIRAAGCGQNAPTTTTAAGITGMHAIIKVTGTTVP